jgi:hypothetical protein
VIKEVAPGVRETAFEKYLDDQKNAARDVCRALGVHYRAHKEVLIERAVKFVTIGRAAKVFHRSDNMMLEELVHYTKTKKDERVAYYTLLHAVPHVNEHGEPRWPSVEEFERATVTTQLATLMELAWLPRWWLSLPK